MNERFTEREKAHITELIHQKYNRVAQSPAGLFKYPTGRAGLRALNYDPELVEALPDAVAESYCGVGNPFALGEIRAGAEVLDVGCGTGVDTIIAAKMTGPSGKVAGIDVTPAMLEKARQNIERVGLGNVSFHEAGAESIPFDDGRFDAVISNGALNLVPDKTAAFKEIIRVLKPGGLLLVADQILVGRLPADPAQRIGAWSH